MQKWRITMSKNIFQQYSEFIKKQNKLSRKIIKQQQENLIDTYLKLSNLINEQDEDLEEDDLEQSDDNLQENDSEDSEETNNENSDTEDNDDSNQDLENQKSNDKADLKFSADLASEFGNTVNQFTKVAAEVVKQRSINKETSDKIYDLMSKIKNLLDAAGKSI